MRPFLRTFLVQMRPLPPVRRGGAFSAGGNGGRRPGLGRMAKAKSIGWAIYVDGFVIWLFGYLSTGHAATFDWDVVAPSWISRFVPNLGAQFDIAVMFASNRAV